MGKDVQTKNPTRDENGRTKSPRNAHPGTGRGGGGVVRTSKNPDKGKISPPLVVALHETVVGEVEIYKTEAVQSVNHDRLAHVKE